MPNDSRNHHSLGGFLIMSNEIKTLSDKLLALINDKTVIFEANLNQFPFLMMCLLSFVVDEDLGEQREMAAVLYGDLRTCLTDSIPETLPIIKEIESKLNVMAIVTSGKD